MRSVECGFGGLLPRTTLKIFGPTLSVQIGLDSIFTESDQGRPEIPEDEFRALIDTGASDSGIDADLAAALQLPIFDQQTVSGVMGRTSCNMHIAQIHIPQTGWNFIGRSMGLNLAAAGHPHQAIIGRDFLQYFNCRYEGAIGRAVPSELPTR